MNGVAFGPDGRLFAASVAAESIFALDLASGAIETMVGPFTGEADDLIFTPAGDMIWTAFLEGIVRMKGSDGRIRDLASGLPGVNSIAFTRDHKRLFVGQVFMGEGLWEIDLTGIAAPRLVVDHTGGLNAFQFGSDGMIYAPSWDRGQVVRVDPESGHTEILADGFVKPGAVRFDSREQLYVLDDGPGRLFALDKLGDGWNRRLIVQLASATDNMAIGSDDLIYVSNMADNSIQEVDPKSGKARMIVKGELAFPRAIALLPSPDGDVIHVADSGAYRTVSARDGAVHDVARAVETSLKFPTSVSVNAVHTILTGETFGAVQIFGRDGCFIRDINGFNQPSAAIECSDGSFVVLEPQAGRVLRIVADKRSVLVEGLAFPSGLADASDGTVYVTESAKGRLLRINLADGKTTKVADGLGLVRSPAIMPNGTVAVLDVDGGRLIVVDPQTGDTVRIAGNLPVGYLKSPYPKTGGVAVGSDGAFYVAADKENALYRISPQ